jgi:hypothetical protein
MPALRRQGKKVGEPPLRHRPSRRSRRLALFATRETAGRRGHGSERSRGDEAARQGRCAAAIRRIGSLATSWPLQKDVVGSVPTTLRPGARLIEEGRRRGRPGTSVRRGSAKRRPLPLPIPATTDGGRKPVTQTGSNVATGDAASRRRGRRANRKAGRGKAGGARALSDSDRDGRPSRWESARDGSRKAETACGFGSRQPGREAGRKEDVSGTEIHR